MKINVSNLKSRIRIVHTVVMDDEAEDLTATPKYIIEFNIKGRTWIPLGDGKQTFFFNTQEAAETKLAQMKQQPPQQSKETT